jgi:hypothetical protein
MYKKLAIKSKPTQKYKIKIFTLLLPALIIHISSISGYIVRSIIYGEAVDCDVRILQEVITIDNTYLGLSRLETIEIENKSDYQLHYEWVQYKNIDEDLEEKEK